jgi:formylglycine-generating enzyme required for sulfatase activity
VLAVLIWAGCTSATSPSDSASSRPDPAVLAAKRAANARTIPDLNLDLVWLAPGRFLMGTPVQNEFKYSENERPASWVTLTQPFWLGRTDVTQGQYETLMGTNPSGFKPAGRDAPVDMVSWDDAMAFCAKLTERERAAGRLPPGYSYTLPTEAQWEYASRAGTTGPYAGNVDKMAWYDKNSGGTTHPVGTKEPNAWGLFDMCGNVWNWCQDRYGPYPGGEVTDPTGPTVGSRRVVRGGSWSNPAENCRSGIRSYYSPALADANFGFRVALSAAPVVKPITDSLPASVALPIPPPPPTDAQKAVLNGKLADFVSQFAAETGILLVPIPSGHFIMGSPVHEVGRFPNEGPQTRVTLTKPFFLAATVVTQRQYEAVTRTNPSHFKAVGKEAPVENVPWDDAMAFCQQLTEREQSAGRLPKGWQLTLPTEAQWEYACRAGTTGPYAGDLDAMSWYSKNSGNTTHQVGTKRPNAWGLYDMHGNVIQRCCWLFVSSSEEGRYDRFISITSMPTTIFSTKDWTTLCLRSTGRVGQLA